MCLIRKTITCCTSFALNDDITILNTGSNETLQSGIATLKGCSLSYFIARGLRMIMQKL